MSIWGAISGSTSSKAAKNSGDILASAATKAGDIRSQGYLDAGNIQSGAAINAGNTLSNAYLGAIDYQKAGYANANNLLNNGLSTATGYMQPYADLGSQSTGLLSDAFKNGQLGTAYNQDAFKSDPSRMWRESQGLSGVSGSAAANGGLSNSVLKALGQNNSNLADGEYGNAYARHNQDQNNFYDRLMNVGQLGQNSANNIAGLTYQNGNNIANSNLGLAQAIADGRLGSARSLSDGMNGSAGYLADAGINSADARAQALYDSANAYGSGLIGAANAKAAGLQNVHHSIGKAISSIFTMGATSSLGNGNKSGASTQPQNSLNINTNNDAFTQMRPTLYQGSTF